MNCFSGQEAGTILKQNTWPTKGVLGQQEIVRELLSSSEFTMKRRGVGVEKAACIQRKVHLSPSSTGSGDAVEPGEMLGCTGEPWPRQSRSSRCRPQQQMLTRLFWPGGAAIFQCVQQIPLPKRTS